MLAIVLSTTGNVRVYDPLFIVPVCIVECKVDRPSLEYWSTNACDQKLISDPVVQVIVLVVPPWKYVVFVGLVILIPVGTVLSKIIVLSIFIVPVFPTRSVIPTLNPIGHCTSVIFMT